MAAFENVLSNCGEILYLGVDFGDFAIELLSNELTWRVVCLSL